MDRDCVEIKKPNQTYTKLYLIDSTKVSLNQVFTSYIASKGEVHMPHFVNF